MSDNKIEELADWLRVQFTLLQEQDDTRDAQGAKAAKRASAENQSSKREARILLEKVNAQDSTTVRVQDFVFLYSDHTPENIAENILQHAGRYARSFQELTTYTVTVEGINASWSIPCAGSRAGRPGGGSFRQEVLSPEAWEGRRRGTRGAGGMNGDGGGGMNGGGRDPYASDLPDESPGTAMIRQQMQGFGMPGHTTVMPQRHPAEAWVDGLVKSQEIMVDNQQRMLEAMLSGHESQQKFAQRIIAEQNDSLRAYDKNRVQQFVMSEEIASKKHERDIEIAKEKKSQERTDQIMDQVADKIMPMGMAMLARWIGSKGIPPEVAPVLGMLKESFNEMEPERIAAIMSSGLLKEKEAVALMELFKLMTAINEKQAAEKAAKDGHVDFTPGQAAE